MPPRRAQKEEEFDEDEELDNDIVEDSEGDDFGGDYEPPEVLGDIHWHRRTIGDLVSFLKTPFLDLNPDYQRDVVWTPDRMTRLINSLMCKYYVPPLIFNVTTVYENGEPKFKRVSIDGKQRLTSILEFVNGKIPCTDKDGKRWFFCELSDEDRKGKPKAQRRILPAKMRRYFLKLEILCAEYQGLERRQEEDLFSRVQLGMPLTPAEKLRASSGPWQDFAITIEKEFADLISNVVDNKRGRGFQLILQIFKQLLKEHEDDPKYSAGATALKGFCKDHKALNDEFKAVARSVFRRYEEVYTKFPATFKNQGYKHATKFSPVEFVGVAVLIHRFPNRNARLLSGDILELRAELRNMRQDLRSNTETWKALIQAILEIEESRGLVVPVDNGPNHIFGAANHGATVIGTPSSANGGDMSTQDATGRSFATSTTGRRTRNSAKAASSSSMDVDQTPPARSRGSVSAATPMDIDHPATRTRTSAHAAPSDTRTGTQATPSSTSRDTFQHIAPRPARKDNNNNNNNPLFRDAGFDRYGSSPAAWTPPPPPPPTQPQQQQRRGTFMAVNASGVRVDLAKRGREDGADENGGGGGGGGVKRERLGPFRLD